MKNNHLVLSVLLICATILLASYNLKSTESLNASENAISVSGEGQVVATPDTVNISAGVSEVADTTKEAQDAANAKLAKIIETLTANGVPEKNIETSNLSFYAEYEWKDDGRELIGQRVRQTLNIKIPEIDENPDRVTDILDALGTVNGLELNDVAFDLEEKEEFFTKAREEAYDKAQQKAEELARLGGVELLKPISINESTYSYMNSAVRNYAKLEMAADAGMGGGSSLPSGELEITANVSVIFAIK